MSPKQKQVKAVQDPLTDPPAITVLSIDGGGVRGIIPAKILAALEEKLQVKENDKSVRIVDYFDIFAGTSAGSIIAAMLASPEVKTDEKGSSNIVPDRRPVPAADIAKFFNENSRKIFPRDESSGLKKKVWHALPFIFCYVPALVKAISDCLCKPTFTRDAIDDIAKQTFKDLTLDKTLKELIIPAYMVDKLRPYIFSTDRAKHRFDEYQEEIKIKDAVLSSTAAPVTFDPHKFEMKTGKSRKEPLSFADGGLAANNPTLLALGDASLIFQKSLDSKNYLVLSLGTGTLKKPKKSIRNFFIRHCCKLRGPTFWVNCCTTKLPLILSVLFDSGGDMVDTYMAQIFDDKKENYLRIQEYDLVPNLYTMDEPNKIPKLGEKADELLKKRVSRLNTRTGLVETQKEGPTYDDLLSKFADELIKQRHLKLKLQ